MESSTILNQTLWEAQPNKPSNLPVFPDVSLVAILKACAKQKDLRRGSRVHAGVLKTGLVNLNIFIANTLVSMYAKCGALAMAQQVFHELRIRDVISWNSLVAGYVQQGHGEEALKYFEQMQEEGHSPDPVSFACALKACASIGAVEKGKDIHSEISTKQMLGNDTVLGTALVDMYAKNGALESARQVLDELQVWKVESWNALISGYCQHKHGEKALECFLRMKQKGIVPDDVTFACILKASGSIGASDMGEEIHAKIFREGYLAYSDVLGNALVDMYAKCGALVKAQNVFDELSGCNVISWNALITGYCQQGQGEGAFECFKKMESRGLSPDAVTLCCILKACGTIGAAEKGREIHAEIERKGLLEEDYVLGNALVDMYAKNGAFSKAQEVISRLPMWDVVSWNGLISGYSEHGHGEEALHCLEQMKRKGLSPDEVTFACILKACGSIPAAEKGNEVHAEIARLELLERSTMLGNALVDMYAKCGALQMAREVFGKLSIRDTISWNSLLDGYCRIGHDEGALSCFDKMQQEGLTPNVVTFACILKAYAGVGAVEKGEALHAEIVRRGSLATDTMLANSVVDFYAKCGGLSMAQEVLDELPVRDVVTWNALIAGYSQHEYGEEALRCFERMKCEGLAPDPVTFPCILKACGSIGTAQKGKQVHTEIDRKRFFGDGTVLGNALVDMYAKCGLLKEAQEAFDKLISRDVVSWNGLIGGYAEYGPEEEALYSFQQMKREGHAPDAVTFTCVLNAIGSVGAVEKGKKIHDEVISNGWLASSIMLGNALVDMYAKCGEFLKAKELFDELPVQSVVSWTALISGYCERGHGEEALHCFELMKHKGLSPDAVTMACVLKACSSIGAVDKGKEYFEAMSRVYGITPALEHHTCMVDLFGRAGHFDKAMEVVEQIPSSDYLPPWLALLGSCHKWENVKLGRLAFDHVTQLDNYTSTAYVTMSKIYAAAGMKVEADEIESLRIRIEA